MRITCKTYGCKNKLELSRHRGARHVYCPECDRTAARMRMRILRAGKLASKIEDLYYAPKFGFVYIIINPAYPGWLKVGSALDVYNRLRSFQTASPHRDYKLIWYRYSDNKLKDERRAHRILGKKAYRKNEWFRLEPLRAIMYLEDMEWT